MNQPGPERPLRIVFFLRHPGFLRNFESTLRSLAERGHRIHLVFEMERDNLPSQFVLRARAETWPGVTTRLAPARRRAAWDVAERRLRQGIDYLRYLEPLYADSPRLRERAERRVPAAVRLATRGTLGRRPRWRRAVARALGTLAARIPVNPQTTALLREADPDLVLVTPLVGMGSPQRDYVRAAQALDLPSGLLVASWDNLTNKGLMQVRPDMVATWNEAQRDEAVRLHGVPAERVAVTGAQAYDHWFDWSPSTSREEFCAQRGLDPARPLLFYACSSPFVARREVAFVRGWIERIRACGQEPLASAGVLVRPHPQNFKQWADVDLSEYRNAAIFPLGGADPVDEAARTDFFDSVFHCAAVVGINTSAQIESAIAGRRVHTLLSEEFRETQEGTLHFRYLRDSESGLLQVARDFDEHARQLTESLRDPDAGRAANRAFLEWFVRPHGLDSPATPRLVAAIEDLGAGRYSRSG